MSVLPVIERELRVAARKRLTYWSRLAAAGFLLVIFGTMLLFFMFAQGTFPFSPGKAIFVVMNWTTFIFLAAWGAFLPCDTLCEEKREGTLGLLFLTDLRGYDIVLGKLVPLLLRSFYTLLAVLPVVALPLMMGGVSGVDFWRTSLVMGNMLFMALCIGLFISAISREVLKAMNAALFLNLIFLVGLVWLDLWWAHWQSVKWQRHCSTASPGYLFAMAAGLRPWEFWQCLIVQHGIAWGFLAGACLAVPRSWKEKTQSRSGWFRSLFSRFRFGGKRKRLGLRRKLVARSPVLWLSLRDRWLPRLVWIITALAMGFLACNVYSRWQETQTQAMPIVHFGRPHLRFTRGAFDFLYWFDNFSSVAHLLDFCLIIWVAMQTCRFYAEAVSSGAMELILVTPLTVREIVRSQWKALWRTFLFTILVVLGLRIVYALATSFESWINSSSLDIAWLRVLTRELLGWSVINSSSLDIAWLRVLTRELLGWSVINSSSLDIAWLSQQIIENVSDWVNFIFRLVAVAWFGMWMGLANRKVSVAVIKTILFVCLLPLLAELFVWIGSNFLEQYLTGNWSAISPAAWVWMLPVPLFELGKNVFFIVLARHRVTRRFRSLVAQPEKRSRERLKKFAGVVPPPIAPKPLAT